MALSCSSGKRMASCHSFTQITLSTMLLSLTRCWSHVSRRRSHIGGGAGVLAHQTIGDTRRDLARPTVVPTTVGEMSTEVEDAVRQIMSAIGFFSRIQPGAPCPQHPRTNWLVHQSAITSGNATWRARNVPELNGLFIKSLEFIDFHFISMGC